MLELNERPMAMIIFLSKPAHLTIVRNEELKKMSKAFPFHTMTF